MDKREIAANMILKSVQSFVEATNDFDYIQSILLAGASLGLTEPLLKQKGTHTASYNNNCNEGSPYLLGRE